MEWVKQKLANRQQQAQAQQQTVAALQQQVESSVVLHRKVAQLEATVASLTRQVMTVSPPGPPTPPKSGLLSTSGEYVEAPGAGGDANLAWPGRATTHAA